MSPPAEPTTETSTRNAVLFLTGLFVFCVGWYGWWIDRPYGSLEINPQYYEQSVRNFEQWGFDTLQGLPMCNFPVGEAEQCLPNMHHPPLPFWIDYALGSKEWQIRLDAAFFSFASAAVLFLLMRRRFGDLASGFAGLLLVLTPMHGFYGSGSCESFVLWTGLALMWAFRAQIEASSKGRRLALGLTTGLVAFMGPWTDWPFVFFCAGLVPLAWPKQGSLGERSKGTLGRLVSPAIPAALGAGAMLWWRHHKQNSWRGASDPSNEFSGLFDFTVQKRPSWTEWAEGMWRYFRDAYTVPLVVVAGIGSAFLIARAPRLGLGLLVAGVLYQTVFASHALEHHYFQAFTAPFVCAAAGALLRFGLGAASKVSTQARWIVLGLGTVLALSVGLRTVQIVENTGTSFYVDVAAVLERSTRADDDPEGPVRYTVGTNVIHCPCYLTEPQVFPIPVTDPQILAEVAGSPRQEGLRYLWLRPAYPNDPANDPQLVALLNSFPMREIPELAGASIDLGGRGTPFVYEKAFLVTLLEPK